ncbi:MAG: hypothetical protein DLM55_04140 [Acidimicrobiales bacterium]|nr:MAG: hypothetical protein DLM55_04140 [Acidimicrobiales bacterium]
MTMVKNVGVRDFRDHATHYLSGTTPVAVSKHGRVIGFYLPLQRDESEVTRALAQLGEVVKQAIENSGLSENEFAALFDLRRERTQ